MQYEEKLYLELGLESLQLQRWHKDLRMFYKIYKNKSPQYLFKLILEKTHVYTTRNVDNIPYFRLDKTSSKTLSFYNHLMEQFRFYPSELKRLCCFHK